MHLFRASYELDGMALFDFTAVCSLGHASISAMYAAKPRDPGYDLTAQCFRSSVFRHGSKSGAIRRGTGEKPAKAFSLTKTVVATCASAFCKWLHQGQGTRIHARDSECLSSWWGKPYDTAKRVQLVGARLKCNVKWQRRRSPFGG